MYNDKENKQTKFGELFFQSIHFNKENTIDTVINITFGPNQCLWIGYKGEKKEKRKKEKVFSVEYLVLMPRILDKKKRKNQTVDM